jgi:hypothetical protein
MSVHSKRSKEGYFMLDHRASPGLTEFHTWDAELPPGCGSGLFEAPTYTCSHCIRVVVIEPKRTRDRGFCFKCHHQVCDECEEIRIRTGECVPFRQLAEESLEKDAQDKLIKEI